MKFNRLVLGSSSALFVAPFVALLLSGCGDQEPTLPVGHSASKPLEMLRDGSPREREQAAQELLVVADQHPAIVAALLVASEDHQSRVQIAAVRALGQFAGDTGDTGEKVFARLSELAATAESEGLQQTACEALGRLGDPRAVPILINARNTDAVIVKVAATMALADCGEPGRQALVTAWHSADLPEKPTILKALARALRMTRTCQFFR